MNDITPEAVLKHYLHEVKNPAQPLSSNSIKKYSQHAVSLICELAPSNDAILSTAIELLCEINSLSDPYLSQIGLEALFPNLIERLNDSFDPSYCQLYDRLFAQVITFSRRLNEGKELDQALHKFGLRSEEAILKRKENIGRTFQSLLATQPVQKIILFSRITLGADVAISSVLISHLKQLFPSAEIVFIGSQKLNDLYGGDPQIRIQSLTYGRTTSLQSRLNSWLEILELVAQETAPLDADKYIILDPDSRLTQLGLLPVLLPQIETQNYFYFPSRSYSHPNVEKLGELASRWISSLTSTDLSSYPFVSLSPQPESQGASLLHLLANTSSKPFASLSFGFGGNSRKRVSEEFEIAVTEKLALSHRLILDCGGSDEEFIQVQRILTFLQSRGLTVLHIKENELQNFAVRVEAIPDVISWQGGIGSFAALIARSQRYVGYDSSGQHIAAASSIPTRTIFVNSGSALFAKRWHPYGRQSTDVLLIEPSTLPLNSSQFSHLLQQI